VSVSFLRDYFLSKFFILASLRWQATKVERFILHSSFFILLVQRYTKRRKDSRKGGKNLVFHILLCNFAPNFITFITFNPKNV